MQAGAAVSLALATAEARLVDSVALRLDVQLASQVTTLLQQVADTVVAITANSMVHADLKAENVVLNSSGDAVVVDFGVSVEFAPGAAWTRAGGFTVSYAPPESLGGFNPKDPRVACDRSDIFSFALMFTLACKHILETLARTCPGLSGVLCSMLSHHPRLRPSSSDGAGSLRAALAPLHHTHANFTHCANMLLAPSKAAAAASKVEAARLYDILAFAELRASMTADMWDGGFVDTFDVPAALLTFHKVGWAPPDFQRFMVCAARAELRQPNAIHDQLRVMVARMQEAAARFKPPPVAVNIT